MIYHHQIRKLKLAQLLEILFFGTIIGAFILLIPMKARAGENQFRSRRGANSLNFQQVETGEKLQDMDEQNSDSLERAFQWSEELSAEDDLSPGENQ